MRGQTGPTRQNLQKAAALFKGYGLSETVRVIAGRVVDLAQYRLDRAAGVYQDLPWLGLDGLRGSAVATRWEALFPICRELDVRTAMDIGCSVGQYPINFALNGIPAVGMDSDRTLNRLMMRAVNAAGVANDVALLSFRLSPGRTSLLPTADAVLLLSVWHHLVRAFGFDAATQLLADVWTHTSKVLFFETGETTMQKRYGLPDMYPSAREWISTYLAEVCVGGTIRELFSGGDTEAHATNSRPSTRGLFAVVR